MTDVADLERLLYELEQQVLRPATRSSRKHLEELLAEDFLEFGSSGGIYDQASVISALMLEQPAAWSIANFQVRPAGRGCGARHLPRNQGRRRIVAPLLRVEARGRPMEDDVSPGHEAREMTARRLATVQRCPA